MKLKIEYRFPWTGYIGFQIGPVHIVLPALLIIISIPLFSQDPWQRIAGMPSTLGLESGLTEIRTPGFNLKLVRASQTVAALQPHGTDGFDFTPGDRLEMRSGDGLYHLGDLTLRLRTGDNREWESYSTATARAPVTELESSGPVLSSADLSNTLPDDIPLKITRFWELDEGSLVLRFEIKNASDKPVEIGSLGIPLIFNNILHNKKLDEAHIRCVFYDPYTGQDAGYLQVTRLHGHGPVLLVTPYGNTPFEAWNPLLDDPTPKGVTFEGFFEWMAHSRAHYEEDWREAEPWNRPTSARLNPGDVRSYGLRFLLSESIRNIENTLISSGHPVAVGIPGYVLPEDVNARLFLNYSRSVRSVDVEPAGALSVTWDEPTPNGWKTFNVKGKEWGRARLTVTYKDGLRQTINYKVIRPEEQVVADMGRFLTNEQWYENPEDPFNRHQSVITWDNEKMSPVLEDGRAWVAGLSDEGGAGSWIAAIMKQLVQPELDELEKMRRFVHETLWGGIQYSEGERKYGVRKSLFFYEPDEMPEGTYSNNINYGTWAAWNRKEAESTVRSYNYPHVTAAYWVLYRLSRNHHDYVTEKPWRWYIEQAYHTAIAMVEQAPHYARFGQMEGTIFLMLLLDLHREGMTELAVALESVMKKRADLWESLPYPFGSEMPWDSTGQEEVYAWSKYFGYYDKAAVTLNAILAYMPAVPHWGYNGSARRYWDFVYAGKLRRIERQIHHYGSALNSIPVLSEFRDNPGDLYLLRIGHAGMTGALANITREGFAPAAFHSYPSTLRIDGITGDYGPGFFGYAVNNGTYVARDREFGWLSFSGRLQKNGRWISVTPASAGRSRVYLAEQGLWLTLDAGKFNRVEFNKYSGQVRVYLDHPSVHTPNALLRVEQPARIDGIGNYSPRASRDMDRGAYIIPLHKGITRVDLRHR